MTVASLPRPVGRQRGVLYLSAHTRTVELGTAAQTDASEIEEAMDVVPGQARKWLERAEQDGEVERVSGRPVKFALRRRSRA